MSEARQFWKLASVMAAVTVMAVVLAVGCSNPAGNDDGTKEYSLTTAVTGGGSVSRDPDKAAYSYGEQVTVMAAPASGYMFDGWSGASTSTSTTVTVYMDGNKTLTANFQQRTYTLTVSANQANGGDVSRVPDKAAYAYGEQVTVTATAAPGYTFSGWSGASTSASSAITVTMDGNKTLTAVFQGTYTLMTNSSPTDGGTISRNPNKTAYNAGETVTLTANPSAHYTLTAWSGATSSTGNTATVVMNADKTVTAIFEQAANAVVITLTSWSSSEDDGLLGGGLDPRIHFVVTSYQNGSLIGTQTSRTLLDLEDVSNKRWSGSATSAPVKFYTQADEIRIQAVVVEKDLLFDDDISPGYVSQFKPIPAVGKSGSATLTGGKSTVGYSYRFVWE